MAEEKKTKTKKNTTKRSANNPNKKNTKKTTTKKATKKTQVKKTTPKKDTKPKVEKKIEKVEKIEKEPIIEEIELEPEVVEVEEIEEVIEIPEEDEIINLEKTLIFDGTENENLKEVVNNLEKEKIVTKDKIITRSKTKKIIMLILTALIVLTLLFGAIYIVREEFAETQTLNNNIISKVTQNQNEEIKSTEIVDEDEYEKIVMINVAEFEKKILNKEDIIVIVTEATCYFCLEYEPIVEEVLQEQEKTIYEIDITHLSTEEVTRFREYYAFTTMPTIFTVKDGVVKNELIGSQDKETLSEWLNSNA